MCRELKASNLTMVCYHPIKAFMYWPDDSLEPEFVFESVDKEYAIYCKKKLTQYKLIKCGKCIGCQMDRSREWANRMVHELQYHDVASFVTLTYAEDYVPFSDVPDDKGEFHQTLRKKELQDFLKRLRKQIAPIRIRFFACGEYGGKTQRPHYHMIIFGYNFPDRYLWESRRGNLFYRSPLLEKVWSDPVTHESKGFCEISDVNWNTCAYVSRYCTKKLAPGHNIYYQSLGIEPEFNTMSRRPGIGRQWYEEHKDELYIKSVDETTGDVEVNNPKIFLTNFSGGLECSPPKYYDRLFEVDNPEAMALIKSNREVIARQDLENKMRENNMNMADMLSAEERKFIEKVAIMKRERV